MTFLFTAAQRLQQVKIKVHPPQLIIFTYQTSLLSYAVKSQQGKQVGGFFGDLYLLKRTNNRVGVAGNFGVGAPVVGVLVEELSAWGVQQFVGIGLAGGLTSGLQIGDLVIADRAWRDEGTSGHYLPWAEYAYPSAELSQKWQKQLMATGYSFAIGGSWSTDAPYRETIEKVKSCRNAGILTVEMEAAALFAVSQALQRQSAAAFVISDTITSQGWTCQPDSHKNQKGLELLLNSAICLAER